MPIYTDTGPCACESTISSPHPADCSQAHGLASSKKQAYACLGTWHVLASPLFSFRWQGETATQQSTKEQPLALAGPRVGWGDNARVSRCASLSRICLCSRVAPPSLTCLYSVQYTSIYGQEYRVDPADKKAHLREDFDEYHGPILGGVLWEQAQPVVVSTMGWHSYPDNSCMVHPSMTGNRKSTRTTSKPTNDKCYEVCSILLLRVRLFLRESSCSQHILVS